MIQCEVIKNTYGLIGCMTLNRPEALNALNLEMILTIEQTLVTWEKDPKIFAVIVRSSSDKAFCAGGDIRAIYDGGHEAALTFFQAEYALNARIYHYKKPYISFLNGITMGGGVGISLHGSHRVAGENFRFAMPETGIGFFPDIGSSYLLNRCPDGYGTYLGLTGAHIDRVDAYLLDLIDYCIQTADQPAIMEQLQACDLRTDAHKKIAAILNRYHYTSTASSVIGNMPWIAKVFSCSSMEDIMTCLIELGEVTEKTRAELVKKAPLSLKVTLELLKRARIQESSLDECLKRDNIVVRHFIEGKDFYEGVRALIIDKDKTPHWTPTKLADVTKSMVDAYFN